MNNTFSKYFRYSLVLCFFLALSLGFYGWHTVLAVGTIESHFKFYLEVTTKTMLLFVGEGATEIYKTKSISLKLAELLALFCVFGSVISGIAELSSAKLARWKISYLDGHLVCIGFTEITKNLIIREKTKQKIVVIDEKYSKINEAFCKLHKIFYIWGDFTDQKVLSSVAIVKSKTIIIATDQDSFNLRIISLIRSLASQAVIKNKPIKSGVKKIILGIKALMGFQQAEILPIKAYIKIDCNVFWRELAETELVKRLENNIEVIPFNLSVMAARHFVWHYPLYSYAELQNQQRIHNVFIGFNSYAESLIERIVTSCLYKKFDTPCFTLLVHDVSFTEKCFKSRYPEIHAQALVKFIEHDVESDTLNDELLKSINQYSAITAIFIFSNNNDITLRKTINIRNELFRCTLNSSPIFIQMTHTEGMQNLIAMPNSVRSLQNVMVPYGVYEEICCIESIEGWLENLASQLHNEYESFRQAKIEPDNSPERIASIEQWRNLSETYRESNRRAVDHIPAKLATVGCYIQGGYSLNSPALFQLTNSPEQLEALSELEQKSWSLGRYVNGWRAGDKRDNRRKIHNLLGKKYAELDEETKGYDRKQINVINEKVLNRDSKTTQVIKLDHWVGLIGHNYITAEESTYIESALVDDILPKLIQENQEALLTLVTPLAIGSDLLMTQVALNYLAKNKIDHRLLIVEAVPFDFVLDDYTNKDGLLDAKLKARDNVLKNSATDWVISLLEDKNYAEQASREKAYENAANYINRRCHTLIAVHREGSAKRKGGTAAALFDRRSAIQENDVFWKGNFTNKTVEIDPQAHKIKIS